MSGYRYQELEHWLRTGISQGRWIQGERLPSIRHLCQQHQAAKATVLHALQRLEAQGLIEARPRAGYFVLPQAQPEAATTDLQAPRPVNISELLLDIMRRGAAFDLLPQVHEPDPPTGIITLNRALARAMRHSRGDNHMYYDPPAGLPALREQLARLYKRRGWPAHADDFCITAGCQHALFLALMACCQKGDIVAVESPGFYGTQQILEQLGLKVIEIPARADTGLDTSALEQALQQWPVRACIVSPAFATPSGSLMPEQARTHLLQLAEQHDLAIIEDDIYADTALNRVPDPLKALDHNGRVILCSSFAKSLSRDLRIGWISGGRWHEQITRLKVITQLATSTALQQGLADFIADGQYAAHLRRQRTALRQQRDQLLSELSKWPLRRQPHLPEGGLTLWLELPEGTDTLSAYPQLLAEGIVITPGALFSVNSQFSHCLRISFAHPWSPPRRRALTVCRDALSGNPRPVNIWPGKR